MLILNCALKLVEEIVRNKLNLTENEKEIMAHFLKIQQIFLVAHTHKNEFTRALLYVCLQLPTWIV